MSGYQNQRNGCGCGMSREKLLEQITQTDFMLVDLQEYLDNHPTCGAALEDFNELSQLSQDLKEEFQDNYGPIMNFGWQTSEFPWQWTDDPWPWEKNFMCSQTVR